MDTPIYIINNLYALDTAVGSGKTMAAINYIALSENKATNFIYVAPTIELVKQSTANLKEKISTNHVRNVSLIHSENTYGGVQVASLAFLNETEKNMGAVCIITTRTFLNIIARIKLKGNWNVILDEAFTPLEFLTWELGKSNPKESEEFFFDTFRVLEDDDNRIVPKVDKHSLVHSIAAKEWGKVGNQYSSLQGYAERVINPALQNEFVSNTKGQMTIVSYVTPDSFAEFNEVVILSALFYDSILYYLWTSLGVIFKSHKFFNETPLTDTHKIQGKNVSIGYILHEKDNASKFNLQKNYLTLATNETKTGERVIDKALETVCRYFKDQPTLLTVNNWVKPIGLPDNITQISVISHGINSYRDTPNIAVLAVTNPEPCQLKWLVDRLKPLGKSKEDIYTAYRIHSVYQAVGRTAVRNKENNNPITFIVLGATDAKYLNKLFVDSILLGQIGDMPRLRKIPKKPQARSKADTKEYNKLRQRRTRGKATGSDIIRLAELLKAA